MIQAVQLQEALVSSGIDARLSGDKTAHAEGFSSLFHYRPETMTFIVPERSFAEYAGQFTSDEISILILSPKEAMPSAARCAIYVDDPREAFFFLVEKFFDQQASEEITGISSDPEVYRQRSFIARSAVIGKDVQIGVGCVIEGNVIIGDRTVIHHNVVIRNGTKIGQDCTIFSGVRIGERGYAYTTGQGQAKHMIKHYGGVNIGNNVHIGENVCISRGAIDDTTICDGVKIDALVHIAHNCVIGKNSTILVPTSVSGSVEIGENCHIAANIIRNQAKIGDGAMLGLGSVVVKDIPPNMVAFGNPARPVRPRREGE